MNRHGAVVSAGGSGKGVRRQTGEQGIAGRGRRPATVLAGTRQQLQWAAAAGVRHDMEPNRISPTIRPGTGGSVLRWNWWHKEVAALVGMEKKEAK